MQRPDGHSWSCATWVRQVTNGLLPQADVLMFVDNDHPGASFAVRWDDVLRLAGDALQEEARHDPPRWRHRGWPDDKTLALLTAVAVPDNSLLKPSPQAGRASGLPVASRADHPVLPWA